MKNVNSVIYTRMKIMLGADVLVIGIKRALFESIYLYINITSEYRFRYRQFRPRATQMRVHRKLYTPRQRS
jgi:hypothetical protein